MRTIVLIIALSLCVSAQQVNDHEKVSGKYGNLIPDEKTAKNAFAVISTGAYVATHYDSLASTIDSTSKLVQDALSGAKPFNPLAALDPKELAKKGLDKAMEWARQYKDAKSVFNQLIPDISKKLTTATDAIAKRVDMWRTTLPTLQSYYKSSLSLADDTRKLFEGITIKDLYDIDRKRDRAIESNFKQAQNLWHNFNSYLKTFEPVQNYEKNRRLIVPEYSQNKYNNSDLARRAAAALPIQHEYHLAPRNTLEHCALALNKIDDIAARSQAPSQEDPTINEEIQYLDNIALALADVNQSYEDSRETKVLLEQERAKLRIQTMQLSQIQTQSEIEYANLIKRDTEIESEQSYNQQQELRILALGKLQYMKANKMVIEIPTESP